MGYILSLITFVIPIICRKNKILFIASQIIACIIFINIIENSPTNGQTHTRIIFAITWLIGSLVSNKLSIYENTEK